MKKQIFNICIFFVVGVAKMEQELILRWHDLLLDLQNI